MLTTPRDEVAFLDLLDPAFRVDSPAVRAAAEASWYAETALGLAILRYADCVALLRDRRLRQVGMDHFAMQGVTAGPVADMWRELILNVEGDHHHRLRQLVNPAFAPRRVEALRPRMREIVHELIDRFVDHGECEFMAEFADHYPPRVMFEMLGLPEDEHAQFLEWAKDLTLVLGLTVAQDLERIETSLLALYECVDRHCADRQRQPGEDILSALVAAEQDGDRLTRQELRSMVVVMVIAGQDSTRNQLGLALHTFTEYPEQWALLAKRPEFAERAVEEVMRVDSTIPVVWRVAAEDLTYNGLEIPAGTRLWLLVAAAQTEPATFAAPRFDITADRSPQLSFGSGMHYCLGALLARWEMREALPILAARLGPVELAGQPTWRSELAGFTGPLTLPIRFTPQGPAVP